MHTYDNVGSAGGRGRAAGAARRAGQPAAGRRPDVRRGAVRPRGAPPRGPARACAKRAGRSALRQRAAGLVQARASRARRVPLRARARVVCRPLRAGLGASCGGAEPRGARRWTCSWTATTKRASWSAARSGAPARRQRVRAGRGLRRQEAESLPAVPSNCDRVSRRLCTVPVQATGLFHFGASLVFTTFRPCVLPSKDFAERVLSIERCQALMIILNLRCGPVATRQDTGAQAGRGAQGRARRGPAGLPRGARGGAAAAGGGPAAALPHHRQLPVRPGGAAGRLTRVRLCAGCRAKAHSGSMLRARPAAAPVTTTHATAQLVSKQAGISGKSTESLGVCWRALGGDTADAHVIKGRCGAAPCAVDQQAALQSHSVCQSPYHFPDAHAHYMHAVRLRVPAY